MATTQEIMGQKPSFSYGPAERISMDKQKWKPQGPWSKKRESETLLAQRGLSNPKDGQTLARESLDSRATTPEKGKISKLNLKSTKKNSKKQESENFQEFENIQESENFSAASFRGPQEIGKKNDAETWNGNWDGDWYGEWSEDGAWDGPDWFDYEPTDKGGARDVAIKDRNLGKSQGQRQAEDHHVYWDPEVEYQWESDEDDAENDNNDDEPGFFSKITETITGTISDLIFGASSSEESEYELEEEEDEDDEAEDIDEDDEQNWEDLEGDENDEEVEEDEDWEEDEDDEEVEYEADEDDEEVEYEADEDDEEVEYEADEDDEEVEYEADEDDEEVEYEADEDDEDQEYEADEDDEDQEYEADEDDEEVEYEADEDDEEVEYEAEEDDDDEDGEYEVDEDKGDYAGEYKEEKEDSEDDDEEEYDEDEENTEDDDDDDQEEYEGEYVEGQEYYKADDDDNEEEYEISDREAWKSGKGLGFWGPNSRTLEIDEENYNQPIHERSRSSRDVPEDDYQYDQAQYNVPLKLNTTSQPPYKMKNAADINYPSSSPKNQTLRSSMATISENNTELYPSAYTFSPHTDSDNSDHEPIPVLPYNDPVNRERLSSYTHDSLEVQHHRPSLTDQTRLIALIPDEHPSAKYHRASLNLDSHENINCIVDSLSAAKIDDSGSRDGSTAPRTSATTTDVLSSEAIEGSTQRSSILSKGNTEDVESKNETKISVTA